MEMTTGYLMSEAEVKTALAICDEFGPSYDGIRDRALAVRSAIKYDTCQEIADASEELLSSVSPAVAARIAPTWTRTDAGFIR